MAGHSKFKNIMYRKGAQDKKRAGLFAKLSREIMVAVRTGGADPASNHRLRLAIATARTNSMPKDNIERAIQRGGGGNEGDALEEIRYEGYGPGGVAIIVDVLTDNRNRSVADIRALFSKANGSLGETGSVAFLFERVGEIRYPASAAGAETMFEGALDAGAEDVASEEDGHEIQCPPDDLHNVASALAERFGEAESCRLAWKPRTLTPVTDEAQAAQLIRLLESLEEHDDVQNVTANFDLSDEMMARLTA